MKILEISTHGIRCGIANYTEMLAEAINQSGEATCDIYPLDLDAIHRCQNRRELSAYFAAILPVAQNYDVVHIQHEYSFFGGSENGAAAANIILGDFLRLLGANGILSATTFHTDPHVIVTPFKFTLRPHKLIYRLRKLRIARIGWRRIAGAFRENNTIAIAHNDFTVDSLRSKYGIPRAHIHKINLLIQKRPPHNSAERQKALQAPVARALSRTHESQVIGIVGFISEYKGHLDAVRALSLLSENYKLIIIGGKHPRDPSLFFNKLLALIHNLNLQSRVFITDIFQDDDLQHYLDLTHVIIAPYAESFRSSSGALTLAIDCGRPVVASAIKPFMEIHDQAPCLELCSPHSPHELAYRIKKVADSSETSRRLTQSASLYAQNNSPLQIAKHHIALFKKIKAALPLQ